MRSLQFGLLFRSQPVATCTQVDFADDVTGLLQVDGIQDFLDTVSERLGLISLEVKAEKCEILLINHVGPPVAEIGGVPVVKKLKILGLYYQAGDCYSLNQAIRCAGGRVKNILHPSRLRDKGCQVDLRLSVLMYKQDVLPTLLFGSPIWGHRGLCAVTPMRHKLQSPASVLPRKALCLPHCSSHWTVAAMSGLEPVQHTLLMRFVQWWNKLLILLDSNALLMEMLQQQLHIAFVMKKSCWLKLWYAAINRVVGDHLGEPMLNIAPLDSVKFRERLDLMRSLERENFGDPFAPECKHRKMALTRELLGSQGEPGKIPLLCIAETGPRLRRNWLRMLGGYGYVPSQRTAALSTVPFLERRCRKCPIQGAADECHVLLHCWKTEVVRERFQDKLYFFEKLPDFIQENASELRDMMLFVSECWETYGLF